MLNSFNKFFRDRRGAMAVEFALLAPVIIYVLLIVVELGRGIFQLEAVEKGLRSGAMVAARSKWSNLTTNEATTISKIENMVKYGNITGAGTVLVPGWSEAGASLTVTTRTDTGAVTGVEIKVIRLVASVPYTELMPGMTGFMNLNAIAINTSHEQVYIGD